MTPKIEEGDTGDSWRFSGRTELLWRDGRSDENCDPKTGIGMYFTDYHPGTTFRTCKICGKCETKTEGDWK